MLLNEIHILFDDRFRIRAVRLTLAQREIFEVNVYITTSGVNRCDAPPMRARIYRQ
jgi:hypothetical protein